MERVLYGVAKTITEHINLGDDYSHVVKVYSISILYFDLGKGSDYLYHGQNRFIGVHTNDELQIKVREKNALVARTPASIFPEYIIIRVNEFDSVAVTLICNLGPTKMTLEILLKSKAKRPSPDRHSTVTRPSRDRHVTPKMTSPY